MSWSPWEPSATPLVGAWEGRGGAAPSAGAPANPPGRRQLAYRVGSYDTFVPRMVDRLVMNLGADAAAPGGTRAGAGAEDADLSSRWVRFNLDAEDNWLIALARSWASVADVLAFYQERLVQEGYLPTAVEPRSVYELVHMVGYQPAPGIAGRTDLAIEVTDVEGLPREIELPARLVVRSVPPPGLSPQVFETAEPLAARAAWNLLAPDPRGREVEPEVLAGATALRLAGVRTGLAVGDPLLVTGTVGRGDDSEAGGDAGSDDGDGEAASALSLRAVRRLTAVGAADGGGATDAEWALPLAADLPAERAEALAGEPLVAASAFALRRQAGLFGRSAPEWGSLPSEVKRDAQGLTGGVVVDDGDGWRSRNRGLPAAAVVTALAGDRDHLYAGTQAHGVFHSTDGGETWEPALPGAGPLGVSVLTVDPRGVVWAGGSAGTVQRSTDHGLRWEDASGTVTTTQPPWWKRWWPFSSPAGGRLPGAAIHDLVAVDAGGGPVVVAATGAGVYRSTDGGRSWTPANHGLPGTDRAAGTTDLPVLGLAAGAAAGEVWAATLRGVYRSRDGGRRWQPRNRGLPGPDPFTGFSSTRADAVAVIAGRRRAGARLLAGTEAGLWISDDGGEHWRRRPLGGGVEGAPSLGAEVRPVTALRVVEDPLTLDRRVYAASATDLWLSRDDGESWRRAELPPGPVAAVAAGPGEPAVVAALPYAGFADDWPGFHLRDGRIDLEGLVDGVVPGTWVVLLPGGTDDPTAAGVYRVQRVTQLRRRDFGLDAMITRLEVDADADTLARLPDFDLRQTRVYLDSRVLPLAPHLEVDHALALDLLRISLQSLAPVRRVIATGELPVRRLPLDLWPGRPVEELAAAVAVLEAQPPELMVTLSVWPAAERDGEGLGDPGPPSSVLEMSAADLVAFLRVLLDAGDVLQRAIAGRRAADDVLGADGSMAMVSPRPVEEGVGGGLGADPVAALRLQDAAAGLPDLPDSMERLLAATLGRVMRPSAEVDGGGGDAPAPALAGPLGRSLPGAPADDAEPVGLHLEIEVPARTIGRVTTVSELSAALGDAAAAEEMPSGLAVPLPAAPAADGAAPAERVDAASLRIFGNVVPAVEGSTVAGEVLGDGDATVANQVFRLARPPVFRQGDALPVAGAAGYAAAPEPGAAPLVAPTVEVRVRGQLWRRVQRLEGADADDRVYRLDVDQDGVASLVFGSGEKGARLPSDKDAVRATYATGMTTRSAPAGGVSLLQNRPLGLDSVSNPLPTTPGAPAEPVEEARRRAPRSVRTLGRVVSLRDHADFALGVPGIARAGAWEVPATAAGGRPAVQITVAVTGGSPAAEGTLVDLRAAVEARRATALPLFVQDYRPLRLRAVANLLLDPGYLWKPVEEEVTARLLERFGFGRAELGGSVSVAAVVRQIQAVPGVRAVDLDELSWRAGGAGRDAMAGDGPRVVRARPPAWEDGALRPAELLLLTDVELRPVVAPGARPSAGALAAGRPS